MTAPLLRTIEENWGRFLLWAISANLDDMHHADLVAGAEGPFYGDKS